MGLIANALRDRLIAVYGTWLEQDDLGRRYVGLCGPESDHGATSVRQFLEELVRTSSGPRPSLIDRPHSTIPTAPCFNCFAARLSFGRALADSSKRWPCRRCAFW